MVDRKTNEGVQSTDRQTIKRWVVSFDRSKQPINSHLARKANNNNIRYCLYSTQNHYSIHYRIQFYTIENKINMKYNFTFTSDLFLYLFV